MQRWQKTGETQAAVVVEAVAEDLVAEAAEVAEEVVVDVEEDFNQPGEHLAMYYRNMK